MRGNLKSRHRGLVACYKARFPTTLYLILSATLFISKNFKKVFSIFIMAFGKMQGVKSNQSDFRIIYVVLVESNEQSLIIQGAL